MPRAKENGSHQTDTLPVVERAHCPAVPAESQLDMDLCNFQGSPTLREMSFYIKYMEKRNRRRIYSASVRNAIYTDTKNCLFIFWTHSNFTTVFLAFRIHLSFHTEFTIPAIQTEQVALQPFSVRACVAHWSLRAFSTDSPIGRITAQEF